MKIIFHPDVQHRSGRVDGYTMVYNKKTGLIKNVVRLFAPPSNPNSPDQNQQRSLFSLAAAAWPALTAAQRAGWETVAETYYSDLTDPQTLQTYGLTGQQVYVQASLYSLIDDNGVLGTWSGDAPPTEDINIAFLTRTDGTPVGGLTLNLSSTNPAPATVKARIRLSTAIPEGYAPPINALRMPAVPASTAENIATWTAAADNVSFAFAATAGVKPFVPALLDSEYVLVEVIQMSATDYLPRPAGPSRKVVQLIVV